MNENLKRCPFCGGEAKVMEAVGVWVKCRECHSSSGVSTGSRDVAVAAWNTRSESSDDLLSEDQIKLKVVPMLEKLSKRLV